MKRETFQTTIHLEDLDKKALDAIRTHLGATTNNMAIKYALRRILREIEADLEKKLAEQKNGTTS